MSQDDFLKYVNDHTKQMLIAIGVPDNMTHARGENTDQILWEGILKSLNAGRGIYLHGDIGTGKSYMTAAIIHTRMTHKITHLQENETVDEAIYRITSKYLFKKVDDVLYSLRASYSNNGSAGEADIVNQLCWAITLVLDDLGTSKPSEWAVQTLDHIIDWRYRNARLQPTIITSNLTLNALAGKYGDRIPSRIAEMCDIFKITGSDRRLRPADSA